MKGKSKLYKEYFKNGRKKGDYEKLSIMTTDVTDEISNSKKNYFDNLVGKSCDPKLNWNAYWSLFIYLFI